MQPYFRLHPGHSELQLWKPTDSQTPQAPNTPPAHTIRHQMEYRSRLQTRTFVLHRLQSSKDFPTTRNLQGTVGSFHHITDTYLIKYEYSYVKVITYGDMKCLVPGTPDHQATTANCTALYVTYTATIKLASHLKNLQHKEPLTYKTGDRCLLSPNEKIAWPAMLGDPT